VFVAVLACTLLPACGDDTADHGRTDGRAARQTVTGARPAATAPPAVAGPSTEPVVVRATNRKVALLADVRAAEHPGFDRVVFEFRGEDTPGYDVRYIERPVTADGSGAVVDVAGTHVIQVRMENALDADLEQGSAPRTYEGPDRIAPGLPDVNELVRTGGFEGVLTWAVGTRTRGGLVVSTLQDPPRLVIDVASG
jgi:hypothetical protein